MGTYEDFDAQSTDNGLTDDWMHYDPIVGYRVQVIHPTQGLIATSREVKGSRALHSMAARMMSPARLEHGCRWRTVSVDVHGRWSLDTTLYG